MPFRTSRRFAPKLVAERFPTAGNLQAFAERAQTAAFKTGVDVKTFGSGRWNDVDYAADRVCAENR